MTFLEKFKQLYLSQPHISVHGFQNQNCPYGDFIYLSRDCYLSFDSDNLQYCLYCDFGESGNTCVDCTHFHKCELCYECLDCRECYNCNFCQECKTCTDCVACYDCVGCKNCYGCVGLRFKENHVFNKPSSGTQKWDEQTFQKLKQETPHLGERIYKSENCTGDILNNCKNCTECFDCNECQDCGYLTFVYPAYKERTVDSYDIYHSVDLNQCYECINVGNGYNCNFCYYCEHVQDCTFCEGCFNSKHLFGCSHRNHAQYEILNVKYEPEEWEKHVTEIKKELAQTNEYDKWWGLLTSEI